MADPSIQRFRRVMSVALAHLEERREEINDLNVFPVPDGDTGDNMALTMRAVHEELRRLEEADGDPARPEIVRTVARAAMMGARGNSGVILSQIVRGAAEELASPPGRLIDPRLIAAALSNAERAAYAAIRDPVEGTMLTVAREMAAAVSRRLAHWESYELSPEASDAEQNALLGEMLGTALDAAKNAVDHTPDQLEVLREYGVVDAGAHGLLVIVGGAIAGLAGADVELLEIPHYAPARLLASHHADSRFRYCANFVVEDLAPGFDQRRHEALLAGLGDSVLVVGDEEAIRVHVHTDDTEAAKALFDGVGRITHEDVENMHEQVEQRAARLQGRTAAVAVASGPGLGRLFADLGAAVVGGGPTLNPATRDILDAIEAVPSGEVVVLPNSKNVHLAAQEAARLSDKEVHVVPSLTQQGALEALVELDPEAPAADNAARLTDALARVRTGGVAPAARDDSEGRFAVGDAVGFAGEEVVAWGDPRQTLERTVERLAAGAEIVTIIEGESPPLALSDLDLTLPNGVEIETRTGGQPNWHWLIAAQ